MTSLTVQDGKLVVRDGKLGTEQACCCDTPGACCIYHTQLSFVNILGVTGGSAEAEPESLVGLQEACDTQNAAIEALQSALEGGGWSCVWSKLGEVTFTPPDAEVPHDTGMWDVQEGFVEASCFGEQDFNQDPIYNAADNHPFWAQAAPENGWSGFEGANDGEKTYVYPCVESSLAGGSCIEVANADECLNWRGPTMFEIPNLGCESEFFPGMTCAAEPCVVECTFFSAAIDVPVGTFTCPENSGGLQAFTDQLNAKLQALSDAMGGAGYTNTSFVPLEIMSNVDCNNPSAGLCNPPTCESYDIGDGTLLSSGTHYVVGECCGTADFENEIPVFLNGVQFNTIPPCVNGDNPLP